MTLVVDVPDDKSEVPVDDTWDEPETKRQKCDADIIQPAEPEKETLAKTTDTWSSDGNGSWGVPVEGSWGQGIEVIEENPWSSLVDDKPESLFPLLGPSALPLTHWPRIVERSMRRIVSITRPPPLVAKSPPLPDGTSEPNANAVELELDRRFAKVVLAPMMIDWDGGEAPIYAKPTILATSQGAVVQETAQPTPVQGSPPPHNPASDEITLLIDNVANHIEHLRKGMGIGGTWVQLARQVEQTGAKKKGKTGYWYIDELAFVIPSFWTLAVKD